MATKMVHTSEVLRLSDEVTRHLMAHGNEFGVRVSEVADRFGTAYSTMHRICDLDSRLELIELSKCDRVRVVRKVVGWDPENV